MSIQFHCEHCGKKIEAPDSASGKWAKCPSCHNKIYVPNPDTEGDDELKLAPVDETEEQRKKQLLAETFRLTQDILSEKETPEGPAEPAAWTGKIADKDLTTAIIMYLRFMADGQLDDAQKQADKIAPCGRRAVEILDKIAVSEIPEPELEDIPQQVLSGLVRTLRTRIS